MSETITAAAMQNNDPSVYEFGSDKTQTISKDLLSRSIRHEGKYGRSLETKPIQAWAMIDLICGLLDQHDINYAEDAIHIQRRSSGTYLSDIDKNEGFTKTQAPIEKWKFEKMINLIQLPNIFEGDTEGVALARNATIGVTLNENGLSVAFGMNVHECTNFNVYGGTLLRTYGYGGKQGLGWDTMKIQLNHWVERLDQIWSVQNEIMHRMRNKQLPQESQMIQEVVGDLYIRALRAAYNKGALTPFNTHELSEFTQKIIQQGKDQDQLGTVWDLYNWGTSIMKPGSMDIGEIANNSNLWSEYIDDYFGLGIQEAVIIE